MNKKDTLNALNITIARQKTLLNRETNSNRIKSSQTLPFLGNFAFSQRTSFFL
jgi:hypothetical protein